MKLQDLLIEMPVLDPKTTRDIRKALANSKKSLGKHFDVEQFTVEIKGDITATQKIAFFEVQIKFPVSGKKGSPFATSKDLKDISLEEMNSIVREEFKKVRIKATAFDDKNHVAKKGEVVFVIEELKRGWVSLFVQYGIPD